MKKNVAAQAIGAQMITALDGSAFTGAVSCLVTGDSGVQAAGGGAVTHEGNGYHSYAPTQAETNFDHIAFTFTGAGAIPATVQVYTTFPQTGDSFARLGAAGAGLTGIPWNAAWDAEVQSECTDAIVAYDPPTGAELVAEIDAVQADIATVQADTNDIQARLPAALVGGRIDSSVGAMAANVLTAAAINAAALNGKGDWNIGKTGYALSGAGVQAIWDALTAALTTANSIGKLLVDNINATISSRASQASVDAVQADTDNIQTRLPAALTGGRMDSSVGNMQAAVITAAAHAAGAIDAVALDSTAGNEIADAILDRNMATGTDSGSAAVRTVRQALRALRNKVGIAAGTLTVTKEDDATASWTAAVTTAAGNPISEVDPA